MADPRGVTSGPVDQAEQWHGVYLVEFSNGCHKIGYSSDLQERVGKHARTALNFRITVGDVQMQVIGTEAEAREVETDLIRAFCAAADGVEAAEYFYGLSSRQARSIFAKVCATRTGVRVAARNVINGAPPVVASERAVVRTGSSSSTALQAVSDDLSAISERGVVRTGRLVDELLAEGWTAPGTETSVQWGVRYSPTSYSLPMDEASARTRLNGDRTALVCRTVGPWSVVEPVEPKPEPVPPPPLSSDPGDWKFRGYDQMGLPAWSWAPVEPKETP